MFFNKKISSVTIYMKDAECAETNETSIFRIWKKNSDMIVLVFKIDTFFDEFEYKIVHNTINKNC